jgi:hypothetical protein
LQELPLVALQIQKIRANLAVGFSLRSGLNTMEGNPDFSSGGIKTVKASKNQEEL